MIYMRFMRLDVHFIMEEQSEDFKSVIKSH